MAVVDRGLGVTSGQQMVNPGPLNMRDPLNILSMEESAIVGAEPISDLGIIPGAASTTSSANQYSGLKTQVGTPEWLEQMALQGQEWAIDYLTNYRLSEASQNSARAWTAQREDSQYQRMIKDLKAVGINPYFALTGGSPVSSAAQGVNYQGSGANSAANNFRTNRTSANSNWNSTQASRLNNRDSNDMSLITTIVGALLGSLGKVASAAMVAAAG